MVDAVLATRANEVVIVFGIIDVLKTVRTGLLGRNLLIPEKHHRTLLSQVPVEARDDILLAWPMLATQGSAMARQEKNKRGKKTKTKTKPKLNRNSHQFFLLSEMSLPGTQCNY